MRLFLVFLMMISFIACDEKSKVSGLAADVYTPKLIGKWRMEQVKDVEMDVTHLHDPQKDRWIQFNADGTFVSSGTPYGKKTGKWEVDASLEELYLDSDENEHNDSYWHIRFYKNMMIWKGRKSDFITRFTINHKRMN